jgi:NTP pyrophosphatase (non-canonical NTP hydrolase)
MTISSSISLRDAQSLVDQWIKNHGVRYFHEMTNLAVLMEEVGELARLFARTYGEQSFKDSEHAKQIPDELADILFVLMCLANQTGVDLTEALERNLQKKTLRDSERHKSNPKLK